MKEKRGENMPFVDEFGSTTLKMEKEDIRKNPDKPVIRMIDDDGELLGVFSLSTLEVVENYNLADYDIKFALKEIGRNQSNWLETWSDYVGFLHAN